MIDRHHVGEPHQLDVWRIGRHCPPLDADDLDALIAAVVQAAPPAARWRTNPYTLHGREIEVATSQGWVEVGECGLAHPDVLAACDLDRTLTTGDANRLRDRIYGALHQGTVHTWASGEPHPIDDQLHRSGDRSAPSARSRAL